MNTHRFSIITCVIIFLIVVVEPVGILLSQGNSPKFYFYSNDNKGFMIGQVDNSSYELLYPYQLQNQSVVGPGWSPSGKWLAWTDDLVGVGSERTTFGVYLTNRDGDTIVLLENTYQVLTIEWAPHDDILYLTKRDFNVISNLRDTEILIYDVSNKEFTAEYHVSELPKTNQFENLSILTYWLPMGDQLAVLYQLKFNEDNYGLIFINKDGGISPHQIVNLSTYCDFDLANHMGSNVFLNPQSKSGEYSIYKYLDNSILSIDTALSNEKVYAVQFVDSIQSFLLFSGTSCEATNGKLWQLSINNRTLTLLSNNVPLPVEYSNGANSPYRIPNLSPVGFHNKIAIPTSTSLYIFDLDQKTLVNLKELIMSPGYFAGTYAWTDDTTKLIFSWKNSESDLTSIYESDFTFDKLNILFEVNSENGTFSLSPNQQFILADNSGIICCQLLKFDRQTEETFSIDFENDDFRPQSLFSEFLWHSSSEWVIVLGQLINDYRYLYLVNINVNTIRELGPCIREESCFGWLPDLEN